MGNTIRDEGGLKYVEMLNAQFARKPVSDLFTGWSKIRVALYCDIVGSAALASGTLYIGLCSGTTAIPGDATPLNAVGMRSVNTGWTYWNTGASTTQFGAEVFAHKTVNGVETDGTTFGTIGINNDTNTSSDSCSLFVDITKGSPNYSLRLWCVQYSQAAAQTSAQFETSTLQETPSAVAGYQYLATKTVAFDETAGTLDAAFVYWSLASNAFRIKNFRVIRFA